MIPRRLLLQNFICYEKMDVRFTENGIYCIYGEENLTKKKNGIGKTAISEAIRFALYGNTKYKDVDRPVKFGEKEMIVKFEFDCGEDKYEIVRTRLRNKSSKAQLLKGGTDYEFETMRQVDRAIVELLGVSDDIYLNSFYLGKSDLGSLTATKLINFLKSVLKLNRFDSYRERAKECLNKVEMKLNKLMGIKETLSKLQSINHNKSDLLKEVETSRTLAAEQEVVKKKYWDKLKEVSSVSEKEKQLLHENNLKLKKNTSQMKEIQATGNCPLCKQSLKGNKGLEDELLATSLTLTPQIEQAREKLTKLQEKELALEGRVDEIDNFISGFEKEVAQSEYQLQVLSETDGLDSEGTEKEYKRLLDLKADVEQAAHVFSPTELPLHILHKYLPELEMTVNSILCDITDFGIEIITQKETKTGKMKKTCELVLYRHGKEYKVENLSGGEETLINMAFRIGISKMFLRETNFQLLVIDEGFGALGDVNQQIVVQMLRNLKKTFNTILIISHVEFIRESFQDEHQVRIFKEGDTSTAVIDI